MADAIAAAAGVAPADVRRAIMLAGGVAPVARAALEEGSAGLARFRLTLYEPLAPMLASPTSDVESALAALESAVLEYKLDGARVQIHKGDDGVRVYSRTGRDVTASVPEVASAIAALPAGAAILDGEVLALTRGRPAAPVPRHDAPLRPQARRRGHAGHAAAVAVLFRLLARRRRGPHRPAARRAARAARGRGAGGTERAAARHERSRRRAGVPR